MSTSIHAVIVNFETPGLTGACLDALAATRPEGVALDASVVDNGSADGSAAELQSFLRERAYGWAQLVEVVENRGLAAGLNHGLRPSLHSARPPDYVLILHPDTQLRPGALDKLLAFLEAHPAAGIVGPRFVGVDGAVLASAFRFPTVTGELLEGLAFGPLTRWLSAYEVAPKMRGEPHEANWLSGAALLVRREVFDTVGLFDEALFLDFGDVDLGMRAYRAGWISWYLPVAEALHTPVGRAPARRPEHWFAARKRYFEKHHGEARATLADAVYASALSANKVRRTLTGTDATPPRLITDLVRYGVRHALTR